eukprot:TRINITY_DN65212_c0_g1_i1.p1 TRINITY_DN65212_c0_g1~~TRINITY_DN65212_c0_g1_i1.p1  ORF type:complete len:403 (+),score=115.77 TRINITY_DN65212_c0_g1_i1:71-1210(+)
MPVWSPFRICVLMHGQCGRPDNLWAVRHALEEVGCEPWDSDVVAGCLPRCPTHDGIEACAERVAAELLPFLGSRVAEAPQAARRRGLAAIVVSFVGISAGPLVLLEVARRVAVAAELRGSLRFGSFVSVVAPLIGATSIKTRWRIFGFGLPGCLVATGRIAQCRCGASGCCSPPGSCVSPITRDLLLAPGSFLPRLGSPAHVAVLRRFARRTLYANVRRDPIVRFHSAALTTEEREAVARGRAPAPDFPHVLAPPKALDPLGDDDRRALGPELREQLDTGCSGGGAAVAQPLLEALRSAGRWELHALRFADHEARQPCGCLCGDAHVGLLVQEGYDIAQHIAHIVAADCAAAARLPPDPGGTEQHCTEPVAEPGEVVMR